MFGFVFTEMVNEYEAEKFQDRCDSLRHVSQASPTDLTSKRHKSFVTGFDQIFIHFLFVFSLKLKETLKVTGVLRRDREAARDLEQKKHRREFFKVRTL